ncbi:transposase [Rhodoplanes serenus]|uniref:Transposase n=1 Tax=Rhodoplanes serenus TaxID=200615 RepID=A0A9X4XL04_9BRAD|nr:exonuclease domain-containing protein [Rhodoplanes serenus]MTW16101.1 transposase [Rhodoplanes serenus]
MDFIAIDVETANADLASICAVGMVYFRNGTVVRQVGFLVDPEDHFDPMNTAVHGITADDVRGAPTLREAFPVINSDLSGPVAHHTIFDRLALCRAAARFGFPLPTCMWIDTARVARRAWDKFARSGYGLANLAAEFGIEFKHHDATEDARAAGLVLCRAIQDTGLSTADWLDRINKPLPGAVPKRVSRAGNPDGVLAGEVLVFTGSLEIPRREAADLAAQIGCDVADTVTKQTTILVVGDQDARKLRGQEKSSKHQKAEKLIRNGAQMRIITESDFRRIVDGC